MATKGLRVAHERFGSDGDPNAPHNRPNFDTQGTQQQPAAAAAAPAPGSRLTESGAAAGKVLTGSTTATTHRSVPPGQAAHRGLALAAAAAAAAGVGAAAGGKTVKVSRPRRTPKVPKYLTEGMVGDGGADAPVRSIAGKGKVCVSLSCMLLGCRVNLMCLL